jgi:nitrogen-specific signal transduction histidine kinase
MSLLYILDSSIDVFYLVTEKDGNIISSNDLFKEYISHIKPKNIADIAATDSDRDDLIAAINKSKNKSPEPIRVYAKTKQKTGVLRYNLWNIYSILDCLHLVGMQIIDVTSIAAHEHERQKILLEEFRFMLSHELRQPLTSIGGLVRMLKDNSDASPKERQELMSMVDDSVNRLDDVIKILVRKAARQI